MTAILRAADRDKFWSTLGVQSQAHEQIHCCVKPYIKTRLYVQNFKLFLILFKIRNSSIAYSDAIDDITVTQFCQDWFETELAQL